MFAYCSLSNRQPATKKKRWTRIHIHKHVQRASCIRLWRATVSIKTVRQRIVCSAANWTGKKNHANAEWHTHTHLPHCTVWQWKMCVESPGFFCCCCCCGRTSCGCLRKYKRQTNEFGFTVFPCHKFTYIWHKIMNAKFIYSSQAHTERERECMLSCSEWMPRMNGIGVNACTMQHYTIIMVHECSETHTRCDKTLWIVTVPPSDPITIHPSVDVMVLAPIFYAFDDRKSTAAPTNSNNTHNFPIHEIVACSLQQQQGNRIVPWHVASSVFEHRPTPCQLQRCRIWDKFVSHLAIKHQAVTEVPNRMCSSIINLFAIKTIHPQCVWYASCTLCNVQCVIADVLYVDSSHTTEPQDTAERTTKRSLDWRIDVGIVYSCVRCISARFCTIHNSIVRRTTGRSSSVERWTTCDMFDVRDCVCVCCSRARLSSHHPFTS